MTWQNIKSAAEHLFIVLLLWGLAWGADDLQAGYYRQSLVTLLVVFLAWGWYCEYEKRQDLERANRLRDDPAFRSSSWGLDP